MLNDLLEIQPFLKKNEIFPQHYYLLFILDYANYLNNKKYQETIEKFNFQFIFFNSTNLTFYNNSFLEFKYEINFDKSSEERIYKKINKNNRFIFIKDFNFEKLNQNYIGPIFYAYKGMTFHDFINEIFEELRERDEKFSDNNFEETSTLEAFCNIKDLFRFHKSINKKIIIVFLNNKDLYFARGYFSSEKIIFNQKYVIYQSYSFLKIESQDINILDKILGFAFIY